MEGMIVKMISAILAFNYWYGDLISQAGLSMLWISHYLITSLLFPELIPPSYRSGLDPALFRPTSSFPYILASTWAERIFHF